MTSRYISGPMFMYTCYKRSVLQIVFVSGIVNIGCLLFSCSVPSSVSYSEPTLQARISDSSHPCKPTQGNADCIRSTASAPSSVYCSAALAETSTTLHWYSDTWHNETHCLLRSPYILHHLSDWETHGKCLYYLFVSLGRSALFIIVILLNRRISVFHFLSVPFFPSFFSLSPSFFICSFFLSFLLFSLFSLIISISFSCHSLLYCHLPLCCKYFLSLLITVWPVLLGPMAAVPSQAFWAIDPRPS